VGNPQCEGIMTQGEAAALSSWDPPGRHEPPGGKEEASKVYIAAKEHVHANGGADLGHKAREGEKRLNKWP